jgi:MFS family permease
MSALRVLIVGLAIIVVGAIPGFLPGSLAPRIAGDFQFGNLQLGVVVAAFYAVSAVASGPAGNLVDRIGASAALRITCAVAAVTMLGAALLGRSTAALAVIVGVSGAGNALGTPGSAVLIRAGLPERWCAFGYGAAQGGASWGSLLAGLALPGIAIPLGWRWVFVASGVLAVVVGLAVPAGIVHIAEEPTSAPGPAARLGPAAYLLAVTAALAATATVSMVSFLVLYALHVGLDERQAGLLLAVVGLGGALGRPVVGFLAGRGGGARALVWASLVLCSGSVGFLLLATGQREGLLLGALLAGGLGASWTGLGTLATTAAAPSRPAAAVGVMMTGLFTGAVGGPLMVGLVSGHAGYQLVWMLNAGLVLAAAGVLLLVRHITFGSLPPPGEA